MRQGGFRFATMKGQRDTVFVVVNVSSVADNNQLNRELHQESVQYCSKKRIRVYVTVQYNTIHTLHYADNANVGRTFLVRTAPSDVISCVYGTTTPWYCIFFILRHNDCYCTSQIQSCTSSRATNSIGPVSRFRIKPS